jgi:hypothetical protein
VWIATARVAASFGASAQNAIRADRLKAAAQL